MAKLETGQYEVLLRPKFKNKHGELSAYDVRVTPSKNGKTYHWFKMFIEIRKDIPENEAIAGERFTLERKFPLKVMDTSNGAEVQPPDRIFIRSLFEATGATSDFTADELSVHVNNKPVLITVESTVKEYPTGTFTPILFIKKIEPSKFPNVSQSALEDSSLIEKEELEKRLKEEQEKLNDFDI